VIGGGSGVRHGEKAGCGTETRSGAGEFWQRWARIREESKVDGGKNRTLLRASGVALGDDDTKSFDGSGHRLRLVRWKTHLVFTKHSARFSFHQSSHLTMIKSKDRSVQGGRGRREFA
jgi:hypothetical protein